MFNFHAGIETKRNLVNNTYSREFKDKQKQTNKQKTNEIGRNKSKTPKAINNNSNNNNNNNNNNNRRKTRCRLIVRRRPE